MSVTIIKRRVQKLGGSSLIVTLPKSWTRRLGVNVGDDVIIVDEGGYLRIYPPSIRSSDRSKSIKIRLHSYHFKIIDDLIKCVYINGFDKAYISIPQHMKRDVEESLNKSKFVKGFKRSASTILVDLDSNELSRDSLQKDLSKIFNEIIDRLENEGVADRQLIETARTGIYHLMRAHKLDEDPNNRNPSVYQSYHYLTMILSILAMMPDMLGEVDAETKKVVYKHVRLIMSNLLGGILSLSSKRLVEVLENMSSLEELSRSLKEKGYVKASTYLEVFTVVVKDIVESSTCSLIYSLADNS